MNKKTLIAITVAGAVGALVGFAGSRLGVISATEAHPLSAESGSANGYKNSKIANELIQTNQVEAQEISELVNVNGKIALNGLKVHQISSRVPGRIDRLIMVEGSSVKAGEPLAWIYSAEFISAQNEFLLARRTARTVNTQATQDLYEDAKATLEGSRNKLRILGTSNSDIQQLEKSGVAQEYMTIASPISGKITKRNVDPGGFLDTGSSLGSVADMSSLWFLGNVFEGDLVKLKEGQEVNIRVAGVNTADIYKGQISFISPTVDPQTHAVVIRVDLPNLKGTLKPDMFAKAEVNVGRRKLPVVPRAAVVQDGAESFVVRQKDDGSFERVSVITVPANDMDHLAITSGITTDDKVVIEGGVLVDRSIVNSNKIKNSISEYAKKVNP